LSVGVTILKPDTDWMLLKSDTTTYKLLAWLNNNNVNKHQPSIQFQNKNVFTNITVYLGQTTSNVTEMAKENNTVKFLMKIVLCSCSIYRAVSIWPNSIWIMMATRSLCTLISAPMTFLLLTTQSGISGTLNGYTPIIWNI